MFQKSVTRAYLGSFFDYGPCMKNLPYSLLDPWNATSGVCFKDFRVFLFSEKCQKFAPPPPKKGVFSACKIFDIIKSTAHLIGPAYSSDQNGEVIFLDSAESLCRVCGGA